MSFWFFSETTKGRGVKLRTRSERTGGIKRVLYTDERVKAVFTRISIKRLNRFDRAWDRFGLKINVGKSKVFVIRDDRRKIGERVLLGRRREFYYLGTG